VRSCRSSRGPPNANDESVLRSVLIRNEIGKIVLNAALYKGIKLKPYETKGKKTGVLLSLQVDADAGLTQFVLKVNAAKVDDLIASLDKAANGAVS
jgi:predicted lactoylglutathione lyase